MKNITEFLDNNIVLKDSKGNDMECLFLCSEQIEKDRYCLFIVKKEDIKDEVEFIVLKESQNQGSQTFISVSNNEELEMAFDKLKNKMEQ